MIIKELMYMQESLDNIMIDALLEDNLPATTNHKVNDSSDSKNNESKISKLVKWFKEFSKRVLDKLIEFIDNIVTFIKTQAKKALSIIKGQHGVKKEVTRYEFNQRPYDEIMNQADLFMRIVNCNENNVDTLQEGVDRTKLLIIEMKKQFTKERMLVKQSSTTKATEQITRLMKVYARIERDCKMLKRCVLHLKKQAYTMETMKNLRNSATADKFTHLFTTASGAMNGFVHILKQISGYVASTMKTTLSKEGKQDVVYA